MGHAWVVDDAVHESWTRLRVRIITLISICCHDISMAHLRWNNERQDSIFSSVQARMG